MLCERGMEVTHKNNKTITLTNGFVRLLCFVGLFFGGKAQHHMCFGGGGGASKVGGVKVAQVVNGCPISVNVRGSGALCIDT